MQQAANSSGAWRRRRRRWGGGPWEVSKECACESCCATLMLMADNENGILREAVDFKILRESEEFEAVYIKGVQAEEETVIIERKKLTQAQKTKGVRTEELKGV
jgi:hypothetical protein